MTSILILILNGIKCEEKDKTKLSERMNQKCLESIDKCVLLIQKAKEKTGLINKAKIGVKYLISGTIYVACSTVKGREFSKALGERFPENECTSKYYNDFKKKTEEGEDKELSSKVSLKDQTKLIYYLSTCNLAKVTGIVNKRAKSIKNKALGKNELYF